MEKMKPELLKLDQELPNELRTWNHFTLWKRQEDKKLPFTLNGTYASPTDPDTWTSYEKAIDKYAAHTREYAGLFFALTPNDPYTVIDLDHCIEPYDNGKRRLTPAAQQISRLAQSYTEITPSGEGLHIWIKGTLPGTRRRRKGIEIYQDGRFMSITGNRIGNPREIRADQEALNNIYSLVFPPVEETAPPKEQRTYTPTQTAAAAERKARDAKNSYKFTRLFDRGDTTYYSYQGNDGKSEADLALCAMLAYWTNDDYSQIEELFMKSALFYGDTAEKWDRIHSQEGETYGQMTIGLAIKGKRQY